MSIVKKVIQSGNPWGGIDKQDLLKKRKTDFFKNLYHAASGIPVPPKIKKGDGGSAIKSVIGGGK